VSHLCFFQKGKKEGKKRKEGKKKLSVLLLCYLKAFSFRDIIM